MEEQEQQRAFNAPWRPSRSQQTVTLESAQVVAELVRTVSLPVQVVASDGEEFFVLLEEGVPAVGAKDLVAVLDLVDDGGQLPFVLHL